MMSSTMPLAERLDWHPVHRANALLRRALLNSAAISPDPAEIWDDRMMRPAHAFTGLAHGPVSITYPASPTELLGLTSIDDEQVICQPLVTYEPDGSAPYEGATEGFVMLDGAAQAQLKGFVEAFNRRQRQASLLVACSVAIAFTLTLGGLLLMFSVTDPKPTPQEDVTPKDVASIARSAEITPPFPDRIRVRANRSAKAALLLIRAKADMEPPAIGAAAASDARVIHATTGRPLALASLLPLGSARYLLLRGLPDQAALSAGRKTGTGSWMVKDEDVPSLTLTLGGSASGDYPVDVYLLEANSGPQARRSLVLRVEPAPRLYTAGLSLGWPLAQPTSEAATPEATETPPVAVPTIEPRALVERAHTLLAEGDIAGARLILMHLAERGDGDAAYALASTYDLGALGRYGANGVAGDPAMARAWYERAARQGHAGAAQRLKATAGGLAAE
ncbi:MAG: hypothetical protein ACRECX_11165 [Methyloceanibacter sp.]|uniref:hypothetical protein n=1 Tax=Methyloceanibacter sp. TaxID=1965321 RepID=UPI003D6D0726